MQNSNNFIGRLFVHGEIETLTGMSIGSGGQSGIGLIDNPVVTDPVTKKPYIPGSSLKGRLRNALTIIRGGDEQDEFVIRLFGPASTPKQGKENKRFTSNLFVRDCKWKNIKGSRVNSQETEIKYENVIDHVTGTTRRGGLRQMERVVPGTVFDFEIVYNLENKNWIDEDLQNIQKAIEFVQDEYLGGSGSRGYGKVEFHVNKLTYKSKDYYLKGHEKKEVPVEPKKEDWTRKAKELVNGQIPAKV